jgi:hypothetical protein
MDHGAGHNHPPNWGCARADIRQLELVRGPACARTGSMELVNMSEYDLRSAFPLNDATFVVHERRWICRLAEVSDQRPEQDRLSWYLVFEAAANGDRREIVPPRKLEIVTSAAHLLEAGFGDDLEDRISEWLMTDQEDGRQEWLDY